MDLANVFFIGMGCAAAATAFMVVDSSSPKVRVPGVCRATEEQFFDLGANDTKSSGIGIRTSAECGCEFGVITTNEGISGEVWMTVSRGRFTGHTYLHDVEPREWNDGMDLPTSEKEPLR